jgi:hypothetical protein
MRGRGNKLPMQTRNELCQAYWQGSSLNAIARAFRLDTSTVRNVLLWHGVTMRPIGVPYRSVEVRTANGGERGQALADDEDERLDDLLDKYGREHFCANWDDLEDYVRYYLKGLIWEYEWEKVLRG